MKFGGISKKLRIAIVLSVIWLGIIFLIALEEAGRYGFDFPKFNALFFGVGILPLIVLWGIIWIAGASKENQK